MDAPAPPPPAEVTLTLTEAARLARVTPETIRAWLRRGELPAEIRIPTKGERWCLPSGALVRHLRAVNPYLGDRIAEELERLAYHLTHSTPRRRQML